ncbi:MAG TPA: restriction endonuclease [Methylophilus sp.]|uniref:restriction endonuclease n=1 Tax=Methylophilus sp. TaxID=29541 RepID=UPI002C72B40D|nr:restriction endonuclease [Methylophilus sp.]HSH85950.1 restriction endonuclease [Methylophilus sp.]
MGTIWIPPNKLVTFFEEKVGYKSGLALTREEMVKHIAESNSITEALITQSDEPIRVRADAIEDAFQILLYKLGFLKQPFVGHGPTILDLKYRTDATKHQLFEKVLFQLGSYHFDKGKHALSDGFNKVEFYKIIQTSLPSDAMEIATELIDLIELSELASPWDWHPARQVDWQNTLALLDLFESESLDTMYGTFFDQRFIDYLSSNFESLGEIHWRKFEALTAEFFLRNGFDVDIGPGRNDGGIDIRIWKNRLTEADPPTILVQCKRQKQKVGKVIVKALWADILDESAHSGLIVTSSALSPGADTIRRARSYPINVADRETLRKWLIQLRSPGNSVFLGW